MSFDAAPWLRRCVLLLLMLAGMLGGGCSPDAFLLADEDRERNFQRAREAERLGDYEGAADFYELAIEKNPRAAAVHLGYASLCEGSLRRHADAVYHYQRYLKLRTGDPKDPKVDAIRRRITNCTEQLATSVPLVIRSETIARDLAAVRGENRVLRGQVIQLIAGVAHWSNEWARASQLLEQGMVGGGSGTEGRVGTPTAPKASGRSVQSSDRFGLGRAKTNGIRSGVSPLAGGRSTGAYPAGAYRTHRVQSGDTMVGLGRRYGVTAASLQRANPHVRPQSMRVGTVLRIPNP